MRRWDGRTELWPTLGAPYHDRDGFIWIDGELVPWREAKLHVLTHAPALRAAACSKGSGLYDGEIFELTEHSAAAA